MTEILCVIFGLSLIFAASTSRLEAYIGVLSVQGFVLFLCVLLSRSGMPLPGFIFLVVETILFKTIVIPWFLTYTVRRNGILREIEPYIPNFYSVAITTFIFIGGFMFSRWLFSVNNMPGVNMEYFGAALTAIIAGLFIITSRKKIITHVIGFVMMENGIFMMSLSVSGEMPFIVNMGVLLDLFIAVFLLGLFASRINSTFEDAEISSLSELKD